MRERSLSNYGWFGETFAFDSELKALRRHPDYDASLDRDAIGTLVSCAWIPQPQSVYAHVRKLTPGSLLSGGIDSSTVVARRDGPSRGDKRRGYIHPRA